MLLLIYQAIINSYIFWYHDTIKYAVEFLSIELLRPMM